MKSKANGSTDGSSKSDKYDTSKNGADHDDSMSGGENRSRSGSPSRDDKNGTNGDKVDHDSLSIYIGNVDYSATEEELRNTFVGCGNIVRVTIIKNMKTGHPKGAAFIEFTDKDGVSAAMDMNGKEVKGRPLIVTSKKPRPENRQREPRSSYDRRPPRSGPPQYAAYGGGRPQYGAPPSRGGYYHGGPPGHMDNRRGGPPQMQMDPAMQARMQPRYDPYRRPDFYDPYMMQRGNPPPPQAPYYGHQDKMNMGGGGGGGHHQRQSQPQQQRYPNQFNNRR